MHVDRQTVTETVTAGSSLGGAGASILEDLSAQAADEMLVQIEENADGTDLEVRALGRLTTGGTRTPTDDGSTPVDVSAEGALLRFNADGMIRTTVEIANAATVDVTLTITVTTTEVRG